MSTDSKTDRIYAKPQAEVPEFVFDASVADVFTDMISRSVPGYATTLSTIGELASRVVSDGSRCYDLGCSLGAATLLMQQQIQAKNCHIVAVDNSAAMIERAAKELQAQQRADGATVELQCADLRNVEIENASLVVLNFTLQFIPLAERQLLLQRIHAGMRPGGILLLSEKIVADTAELDGLLIDLHHQFKRSHGYSDLEISQKRQALENTLRPETVPAHQRRLAAAGFSASTVWYQCFNFVSLLAKA